MAINPYERYLAWELMTPMEKSLWGTVLALHLNEGDAALQMADAAVEKLRTINTYRAHRPEPEYEAARAGFHIEYETFDTWYRTEYLIRHGKEANYRALTSKQVEAAYERFERGRSDYY